MWPTQTCSTDLAGSLPVELTRWDLFYDPSEESLHVRAARRSEKRAVSEDLTEPTWHRHVKERQGGILRERERERDLMVTQHNNACATSSIKPAPCSVCAPLWWDSQGKRINGKGERG